MTTLRQHIAPILSVALCLTVTSCKDSEEEGGRGGAPANIADTHESLANEVIELMNTFAGTMGDAESVEGARAAVSTLDGLASQFEDVARRMETLGLPTGESKSRIEKMVQENEAIIEQRATRLASVMLGKKEIGEILQKGIEEFGARIDKLTVLVQWSGRFNSRGGSEKTPGEDDGE